jgi:hypothetical protein
MSMLGYLRQIRSDEVLKLQRKPTFVKQLLRGPYDLKAAIRDRLRGKESPQRAAMEAAQARSQRISDQIRQSDRPPGPITAAEYEAVIQPLRDAGAFGDDKNVLKLEKSWHTLHYLLTGSAEPVATCLGKAILGGAEIGPDLGYGPARLLSPEEVRQVAEALAPLSKDDLAQRFNLPTMEAASIYACDSEEELELAQAYFERMKYFYADAAARGNAMVLYLK